MWTGFDVKSAKTKRSIAADPQPGDVLVHRGYSITVNQRQGDQVFYTARCPTQTRRDSQTLEEWGTWAGGAKVRSRGAAPGECTELSQAFIAGALCYQDGVVIEGAVHCVDDQMFCAEHCPNCAKGTA